MMARVMRYDGIPTTRTVRECGHSAHSWLPCSDAVERTVVDPIYVVPQMLPCPECDGTRKLDRVVALGVVDCPTCDGLGVVAPPKPDYIATAECRHPSPVSAWDWNPWASWCGIDYSHNPHERRQVVAYKVTAIDPLPVVDDWSSERRADRERAPLFPRIGRRLSHWYLWLTADPDEQGVNVTDEPWAASLRPGQVVWRLHLQAVPRGDQHALDFGGAA